MEETTDQISKKRSKTKVGYGCKVVWEKNGLIVLMVSNPYKTITKHANFLKIKEKDEPWCHVLIDNRYGREFIAIEKNSAFKNPDTVSGVIEHSLRARFAPHHTNITVQNQYEPDAFWEVVEKHQMQGINEVAFHFSAPNNPWASELIGHINDAARCMHARPTTIFSSSDGDPLVLDKSNQELCNYVEACAMEGEDIQLKVKGIRSRIHIMKVSNKFVLKQMKDDTFRCMLSEEPELFEENFDALTAFLNQIHTSKEDPDKL